TRGSSLLRPPSRWPISCASSPRRTATSAASLPQLHGEAILPREGQEGVDDCRIEESAPPALYFLQSDVHTLGRPVGAVGRHGLDDVGDGDDPCAELDLVAPQTVRVARSVVALVMLGDHSAHGPGELDAGQDVGAGRGVALDQLELGVAEATGTVEDLRRNGDLADVVDGCRHLDAVD